MDELFELIDSRIKKNDSSLRSVPCKVVAINKSGLVEVELISNKATYTVCNYSGSKVEVGETVQLFYKGIIENSTAYIGAALYKPENNSNHENCIDAIEALIDNINGVHINTIIDEINGEVV